MLNLKTFEIKSFLKLACQLMPPKPRGKQFRMACTENVEFYHARGFAWIHSNNTSQDVALRCNLGPAPEFATFTVKMEPLYAFIKKSRVDVLRIVLVDRKTAQFTLGDDCYLAEQLTDADQKVPVRDIGTTTGFAMPADFLKSLTIVAPAMCKDETRFHIEGARFDKKGSALHLVATDGHRLHTVNVRASTDAPDFAITVPSRAVHAMLQMGVRTNWHCEYNAANFSFTCGNLMISGRHIDSPYPPYEAVIPTGCKTSFECEARALEKLLKSFNYKERDDLTDLTYPLLLQIEASDTFAVSQTVNNAVNNATTKRKIDITPNGSGTPKAGECLFLDGSYLADVVAELPHKAKISVKFGNSLHDPVLCVSDNARFIIMQRRG